MQRTSLTCLLVLLFTPTLSAQTSAPSLRDLNAHCPFDPPPSLAAWQARAKDLKLQLQVALGLSPRTQLDPVAPQIYGRIERDDYTIEMVTFESLPGLIVTGNLYRPKNIPANSRIPGILAPHGHWENARFYDASPAEVSNSLANGAERFEAAARNHIQARCVQLARMGCIVFHWDMLGYCDSQQINLQRAHLFAKQPAESEVNESGWLLFSPRAEAHSQSILGLQTLAIERAVDMLLTLPEVDPSRIGISGASGGGTQSFLGAALDERIALAFPAVMVSTGMQGGCTCENACSLRTGTGNVEMAALIAPRPLGLTAADDWTRTMPQDGFPQLQTLYSLYNAQDHVALFPAIHFGHNFNHVSRVALYGWVSDHFKLGFDKPILERDFKIALRDELSVWDGQHPQPEGGEAFERQTMKLWAEILESQLQTQLHGDAQQLKELAHTLHDGWRVCLGLTTPQVATVVTVPDNGDMQFQNANLPAWEIQLVRAQPAAEPPAADESLTIEISSGGTPIYYTVHLAGQGAADSSDGHTQWQALVDNPRLAAAYTYGYNLPLFAQRAEQLGIALRHLASINPVAKITLRADSSQSPLAAAGMFVANALPTVDDNHHAELAMNLKIADFAFADVPSIRHPDFLPGAARFWDLPGLVACSGAHVELSGDPEKLARYHPLQLLARELGGEIKTVDPK